MQSTKRSGAGSVLISGSSSHGSVRIDAQDGRICCDIARLIGRHGEVFVKRLIERTLHVPAVDAIAVDWARGAVTIEYDSRRADLPAALDSVAGALRGGICASRRGADFDVKIQPHNTDGALTRVDRVHQITGEVGAGRASCGGFLRRLQNWAGLGAKATRHEAPRSRPSLTIFHGLVVQYASAGDDESIESYAPDSLTTRGDSTADDMIGHDQVGFVRDVPVVATGLRRLANLAAAGGCFLLAVVGFVTPGIPTIPFVLGTSHFLVRSTPSLNARLRASRLFGRLISDWEDRGGLRRATKAKAIGMLIVLVGVTVRTAASVPFAVAAVAMAGVDLWIILRLPTVENANEPSRALPALLPAG